VPPSELRVLGADDQLRLVAFLNERLDTSLAAQRCYRALGYVEVGEYGIVLFER